MGRNSLYYIDIVKNDLPSKKTNKIKSKQINKIEPINKNNLLEPINKNNLLEQINNKINSLEQISKIKL
jgi:hypothetical protein